MDFTELKKLAKKIKINPNTCKKAILDFSNKNGVKLLHELNGEIIIPTLLYKDLINMEVHLNSLLTPYSEIINQKSNKIPFSHNGYIYYLFNNDELVYIGQSTNLAQRIGAHYRSEKIFDEVYAEEIIASKLMITEALYIYRDIPKGNVSVLSFEDYLKTLLNLINIDNYLYL